MQQPPIPSQPFQQSWQSPTQTQAPEQQSQPQPLQEQWQPQQQMPPQPGENRVDLPSQTPPQYQQSMTPGQQMYPPIYAPQMNNVVVVNVNKSGPSFLVRVLWYLFIGWWLGFFWLNLGYFFCFTVIGLPLGLLMLNRLPWVLTLRPTGQDVNVNVNVSATTTTTGAPTSTTTTTVNIGGTQQYSMLVRALYFVFVGSWAGYIWACVGYTLCLFIVTIPLGLIMLNRLPAVITLRRN